jgi:hypothetical protein
MLDSSRRLRVDKSRPSFPQHDLCGQIDADAVPTAAGVQPCAELGDKLAAPERESLTIVYCGSAQEVSEGFAIALRAMGVEANDMPWGIAPNTTIPNREDN